MNKFISISLLAAFLISSTANAARPKKLDIPAPPRATDSPTDSSGADSAKIWLAPPASFFLGFGAGHMVQDRYRGYPIAFTVADSVGFLLIIASMGSCSPAGSCQKTKDRNQNLGLGLLIASRLAQVIDVTLWSVNHLNEPRAKVSLVPVEGGMAMMGRLRF